MIQAAPIRRGTSGRLGLNRTRLRTCQQRAQAYQDFCDAMLRALTSLDDTARSMGIRHADGATWWHDAPLPKRWHRCRPWTTGPVGGHWYERCACGGIRSGRFWDERNSRRRR